MKKLLVLVLLLLSSVIFAQVDATILNMETLSVKQYAAEDIELKFTDDGANIIYPDFIVRLTEKDLALFQRLYPAIRDALNDRKNIVVIEDWVIVGASSTAVSRWIELQFDGWIIRFEWERFGPLLDEIILLM
jgi:hypothetical protein